ncbi:hypothetical protein TSOC_004906 [Tetrabaena socialis]|uniref:DUF6737 domain-containing protein n=1 Tax=Tetrabaena socialis TaxID=47790 RepID=A0A2J8A7N3_9CHLO|nr:hypothetical protein TSOC_004906 [Tetrabaena socialis]|eukprot:PNH08531.1 hypothetical protein TSOC_004906 [Tetrabaena socialis]
MAGCHACAGKSALRPAACRSARALRVPTRTTVAGGVRHDAGGVRSRSGFAACSSSPRSDDARTPASSARDGPEDDVWVDSLPAALGLEREGGPADPDMWASKPAWCQPWTILTTGTLVVAGGYTLSGQSLLVGVLLAVPVAVWWWLFLLLVPAQYKQAVEEYNAGRR